MHDALRDAQRRDASKKTLDDAAERLGVSPKSLCEAASETVGLATWYEFQQTGIIPTWLESHCYDIMLKSPRKAENLLGGIDRMVEPKPVMGLGASDLRNDPKVVWMLDE